jgi:hypothetical protein
VEKVRVHHYDKQLKCVYICAEIKISCWASIEYEGRKDGRKEGEWMVGESGGRLPTMVYNKTGL